jgi:hypothetical protein
MGTIDNMHVLRKITEVVHEFDIQIDIPFIGFKQSFDSIYRHKMIKILLLQLIPSKLIRLNGMILEDSQAQVHSYRENHDRNLYY